MKRLLVAFAAILMFLPSCGGAKKDWKSDCQLYHWTGTNDQGPVELVIAARADGLISGFYHWTHSGSEYTSEVLGNRVDGAENNLLLSVYSGPARLKSLPGEIMPDGSYKGWEIGDYPTYETEICLQKAEGFPEDFENPFEHLKYKELKKFAEFADVFTSPVYGPCGRAVTILTSGANSLSFYFETDIAGGARLGNMDSKLEPEGTVKFKDGFVEYTEDGFTCRMEFFKNFMYVTRVSEFDANNETCMDSDKLMGFYPLQSIGENIPETWWEGEGMEEDDMSEYTYPSPEFTDVSALLLLITNANFAVDGRIPVDVQGRKPDIEDYFKAFCARFDGPLTTRSYKLNYNIEDIGPYNYATMDKKHGYFCSSLSGHYYDGLQMCYWKTPTDHDIVGVRMNYTSRTQYDTSPAVILVLYEYDTEKHTMNPKSTAGAERWAISDDYYLPGYMTESSCIELPQEGKDILCTEYEEGSPKNYLRWNGEWFDF